MREHWGGKNNEFEGMENDNSVIEAIPGGVVITNIDDLGTIIYANEAYYEMIGYDQEEYFKLFGSGLINILEQGRVADILIDVKEQVVSKKKFSFNARIVHKNKGYIWANFSGKLHFTKDIGPRVYMVIVDVSEPLSSLQKLEETQFFNEIVEEIAEEHYFDCDLIADTIRYSNAFAKILGIDSLQEDYLRSLRELGLFCDEKYASRLDFLKGLGEGIEQELRLRKCDGNSAWYLCKCSLVEDNNGNAVRFVGKFIDITKHKEEIDALSDLAFRDQLTGLYNKSTTETRIKDILKRRRLHDDNCALMIIDIDNFKNINDRLGHLYGDVVLTQLAEKLRSLFRSDDIVGRIGGDEFFVFLKSYKSINVLAKKAKYICSLFHKTYSQEDTFVTISASIGIALCPEHGTEFGILYRKADMALYEAKAEGKNRYGFYALSKRNSYTSQRTKIDRGSLKKSFKDNKIEYAFRLLYDSKNPVSAIGSVLQLITEAYGFSRGYIFETSADGNFTSNTFEWCIGEITAQIDNLQDMPIEDITSANNDFLDKGMFILKSVGSLPKEERDILEPQGIKSMFQFGIMDIGKLVGFIGFDDCISERIPNDEEIDEICTVCHVLATFLLKHRSNQREIRHHEVMEMVMNNIERYIHVIDSEDYSVLYENQQIVCNTGCSNLGKKCYEAYKESVASCEDCPLNDIDKSDENSVFKVKHQMFGAMQNVELKKIKWYNGKEAFLFYGEKRIDKLNG